MNCKKRIAAALTACAILMGMPCLSAAAAEQDPVAHAPPYYYQIVVPTGKDGTADGKVELELYARPTEQSGEAVPRVLDAGTFGLRFPKWVGQLDDFKFTADSTDVALQPTIGGQTAGQAITASQYLVFTWSKVPERTDWADKTLGRALYLGTVSFTLPAVAAGGYQYPSKTSIGVFNWLKAAEADVSNFGSQAQADAYNETIWKDGCYQGYAGTDADGMIQQQNIGFQFDPPSEWPNAFSVLSYDPKKQLTVSVFTYEGGIKDETALHTVQAPLWQAETGDTGEIYGIGSSNVNTGVGIYANAVNLDDIAVQENTAYLLVIEKPGHLTRAYAVTTGSGSDASLTTAEGMPKEDEEIYLPCGDVNPKPGSVFGDGRIDLADRAALLAHLGRAVWPTAAEEQKARMLADLDGDDKVTMADLSILMSPINFLQTETGVG